ncbi:MAG TPA: serine/threonine-protein kinase [Polyangiaceae bacterium]
MIGRYALHSELATGGMATVYLGRLLGPVGFSRTVAIKRLHQQFAKDPEFTIGFLDEARLAARIRHPNVVPTLDVVALEGELFLVMEYVHGESLAQLALLALAKNEPVPVAISIGMMCGVLHGLHAAHEARNERGELLGLVHRDVSPQNILVGADGVPRLLDFGVAKAVGRVQNSRDDKLKGKLAYMAPEQVMARPVSRQSDVFAASVVLWELLTGRRLFRGQTEAETIYRVLQTKIEPPSRYVENVSTALDDIVMKGLQREASDRYASAREMAVDLERVATVLSAHSIGDWVERVAGEALRRRATQLALVEQSPTDGLRSASSPPPRATARTSADAITLPPDPPQAEVHADPDSGLSHTLRRTSVTRRSLVLLSSGIALVIGLSIWLLIARSERPSPATAADTRAIPSPPDVHIAPAVVPSSTNTGPSAPNLAEPMATDAMAAHAPAAPASARAPSSPPSPRRAPARTRPAAAKKPAPSLYSRE